MIVKSIIGGLIKCLPALIQGAIQLFMALIKAVPIIIKELIPEIPKIITAIVTELGNGVSQLLQAEIAFFLSLLSIIMPVFTTSPKSMIISSSA